jgi:hypothetical protein
MAARTVTVTVAEIHVVAVPTEAIVIAAIAV